MTGRKASAQWKGATMVCTFKIPNEPKGTAGLGHRGPMAFESLEPTNYRNGHVLQEICVRTPKRSSWSNYLGRWLAKD